MKQLNWYQIFGNTHKIPDGRTVEPTDDIQIWLHCANIWDKTYTTLAEVLADTDTLSALISSNNAVDYMVRSTTWAVATALVPKMTSNTTPSGEAFGNERYANTAYIAFDRDTTNYAQINNYTGYLGYRFPNPVTVGKIYVNGYSTSQIGTVEATSDNVTWETICNFNNATGENTKSVNSLSEYSAFRINLSMSGNYPSLTEAQFYSASVVDNATAMAYIGLNNYAADTLLADATWLNAIANSEYIDSVLNVKNPNMTSNTTPEGEVIYSYAHSEYRPYYAFDGNLSTQCAGPNNSPTLCYYGYKFTSARKVLCCVYYPRYNHAPKTRVQASVDNNTWVDMSEFQECPITNSQTKYIIPLNSPSEYQYYRCQGTVTDGNGYGMNYWEINFYGREDV